MEPSELKRRRKAKAVRLLGRKSGTPHFTTTEALCLIDAACGPVKFHRILVRRGLALPVQGFDKGYTFSLPTAYGSGTYSIRHHSFQWSPQGVAFIATVLGEEGISHNLPAKVTANLALYPHEQPVSNRQCR